MEHSTAIVESSAVIGKGTKVWAFSHISAGAKIGRDCVIGEGVHIGPNVIIGDRCKIQNHSILYEGLVLEEEVFIGPNVITTNDPCPRAIGPWKDRFLTTMIREGASIGANCTILCGIELGAFCMIGCGSVVTQNIKSLWLAYGNPAHHVRQLFKAPQAGLRIVT